MMTHNQDTNPAPGNDVNNPIREQVQRIRPVPVFRRGRNFQIGSKIDCRAIKLFQKPIRDYTTCFVAVVVAGVSTAACGELAQLLKVLNGDQGAALWVAETALRSQRISVPSSGSFSYSSSAASQ